MGARRRRRKLTTLMGRFDSRIRDVELRPINLLTSSQIDAAVTIAPPGVTPSTVVGASAPAQFRKIQDAYIYPKKLTGLSEDRVEIYLESDLGLEVGETIEVSGIHGTSTEDIDVDGTFEVKETDTPPWTGRDSYDHDPTNDQLSGVTISNTYSFKPDTVAPTTWSTRKRLQTRRLVDTYEITSTTVTLTMNADHKFEAGDIIFVDIFAEDSRAYGVDGLFEIDSVTNNTIVYTLAAGVDTPVSATIPAADVYVFPVAREYLPIGSTWASSNNNKIYYWDGIRWVDYSTVSDPAQDGDPPSPPTSLNVTSEVTYYNTSLAVSKVTVGWTAPTTSVSGDPLTDLAGYKIRWRELVTDDWKVQDIDFPTTTSYTFDGSYLFKQGTLYYFEVYAYDSGRQDSTALTGTHTTDAADPGQLDTLKPTPPTISSYLGTLTLTWDGLMDTNPDTNPPSGVTVLEVHRSLTSSFTVSDSTLIGTVAARANTKFVASDVSYGTSYYFRFRLRNAAGVSSLPSDEVTGQTTSSVDASAIAGIISAANIVPGTVVSGETIVGLSITGQLIEALEINGDFIKANSIEADRINVGTLAGRFLSSDIISTSATQTGARVDIDSSGISAYNSGGTPTFTVNAATGQVTIASGVTIGGYATNSNVSAVSTVATTANNTANSAQSTATTANSTANTAISDVQAVQNNVYFPGTTQINGGSIRTGTIVADALGGATLTDFLIAGNDIATSSTNPRVKMNNAGFFMFNGSGSPVVRMYTANAATFFEGPVTSGGTVTGATITAAGGVVQSSSSFPRVELESNVFNSVRFRFTSTNEAYFEHLSGAIIARGGFAVEGLTTGTSTSYYVVGAPFTGILSRGPVYSSSDRRLKDNIADLPLGLDFISSLNPVTFNWKKDSSGKPHTGLIAQEVLQNLNSNYPEYADYFVKKEPSDKIEGEDSAYGIKYERFIPSLINSVKELSAQVEELKKQVEYLEKKDKNADS